MAIDLKRYQLLKSESERMQRDASRAEGALSQVMGQIKEEFGCDTVEQAERKLKKLSEDRKKAEAEYDVALAAFESKWGDKLKEGL